ncbi:MAG TPA: hypothetical protein VMU48_11420 [Terracidiphilus sp.]|nr:hypothetical protein [Terracidiphilus sp.]
MFVRLLRLRLTRDWLIGLSEKGNPGTRGGPLCRKRYIDEKIAASRNEIDAVVNPGAGFDNHLFCLPTLSGLGAAVLKEWMLAGYTPKHGPAHFHAGYRVSRGFTVAAAWRFSPASAV